MSKNTAPIDTILQPPVNACDEITDEDAGKEGSLNINNF
jgi:hypothetical protein